MSAISLQRGSVDPIFQVEGVAPTKYSSSQKITITVTLKLQIFLPFCHNARVWQTDGRTDKILIARPRLHSMQRGKNRVFSPVACMHGNRRQPTEYGSKADSWAKLASLVRLPHDTNRILTKRTLKDGHMRCFQLSSLECWPHYELFASAFNFVVCCTLQPFKVSIHPLFNVVHLGLYVIFSLFSIPRSIPKMR